jgi:hypothetical protein
LYPIGFEPRTVQPVAWYHYTNRHPVFFTMTAEQKVPLSGYALYNSQFPRPWGFQEVEAPRFQDYRHMKMVKLSALSSLSL